MLPRRKSPTAASRANSPARLLSSSGSDGSLTSSSKSGCFNHNQTTPLPASTPATYIRVAHPLLAQMLPELTRMPGWEDHDDEPGSGGRAGGPARRQAPVRRWCDDSGHDFG